MGEPIQKSLIFSQNDDGALTRLGESVRSPETDQDFSLRISEESIVDAESFTYTAQNTGKFRYGNTTMTTTWPGNFMLLNGSGITTTTTSAAVRTWNTFPIFQSVTTYFESQIAFTVQCPANCLIEWGFGITNATGAAAPTDGAFFRLTNVGLACVASFNGTETSVLVSNFSFANTQSNKYTIAITPQTVDFWINNVLGASISVATNFGIVMQGVSSPVFFQQRHTGTASPAIATRVYGYTVSRGGISRMIAEQDIGNFVFGSYQGLSGGTMGSLTGGTVTTGTLVNPTAAVATNTTAALGTGLGGQFWETDTLAANTDGIIMSYQVPAGSAQVPARRLLINGIYIDSFIQTVLTGGGYNAVWTACFGHTAVSLQTAEAATGKAPRRNVLGSQSVASGAAALVQLATIARTFDAPIIVNPGEFFAIAKKKVGTAPSGGVIAHNILIDYRWV
jgi:hypothetical protein